MKYAINEIMVSVLGSYTNRSEVYTPKNLPHPDPGRKMVRALEQPI